MSFIPRSYQKDLGSQIMSESRNCLVQADTGAGKTPIIASVVKKSPLVIVVAHRNILIRQASATLAKHAVVHDTICSDYTRRLCILEHRRAVGREFIKPGAKRIVSSIDRLLSLHRRGLLKIDTTLPWKIIVDEAHHMIDDNKWGRLCTIFPNARIIGFTATPCRADGRSLAKSQGGVFDVLIQADELREDSVRKLISWGFLSDFKVYSIPGISDDSRLIVGKDGEYTSASQLAIFDGNEYVFAGSALEHYRRLADGKQAIVFCVGIKIAEATAKTFKSAGYAAACISSAMSQVDTARIFDLFRNKHIQVICHVDMLGEGVDVPAIEAMIMLRKTASLVNYRQWIGRTLRPEPGKDHAIIIDHCGNVLMHDMPDKHIAWSLENPPKEVKSNLISCSECDATYKAWLTKCPECGAENKIKRGSGETLHAVKYLDFDLIERERIRIDKEFQVNNVIRTPNFAAYGGAIGKALEQIFIWFCDTARASDFGVPDINRLVEKDGWKDKFWFDNFTLADMKKNNTAKVGKVMSLWLKKNAA